MAHARELTCMYDVVHDGLCEAGCNTVKHSFLSGTALMEYSFMKRDICDVADRH